MKPMNKEYITKAGKDVVFSFRIDEAVYEYVRTIAKLEKRSINSQLSIFVEDALIEYMEENGSEPPEDPY